MTSLSKSFTLEEVEGFLAAERERCAKVAEDPGIWVRAALRLSFRRVSQAIAAAIRSLAPQTIGDE